MTNAPADEFLAARRFAFAFTILLVGALAGTAATVYAADPTGEFEVGLMPPMIQLNRELKSQQMAKLDRDTSVLVLGSSTSLRIVPSRLDRWVEGKAYNAAVNAGGVLDLHAALELALEREKLPIKTVIVGLDLDSISPVRGPSNRLRLAQNFRAYLPEALQLEAKDESSPWRLLSTNRAKLSLKALNFQFVEGWPLKTHVIQDDGTQRYLAYERDMQADGFDLLAALRKSEQGYRSVYAKFHSLDGNDLELLEAFFDRCEKAEISVYCFLSPMHPKLQETLKSETSYSARRDEFRTYMHEQAKARGISFFDASDLSSFGGDAEQFYDGVHAFSENMERILDKLFERSDGDPEGAS